MGRGGNGPSSRPVGHRHLDLERGTALLPRPGGHRRAPARPPGPVSWPPGARCRPSPKTVVAPSNRRLAHASSSGPTGFRRAHPRPEAVAAAPDPPSSLPPGGFGGEVGCSAPCCDPEASARSSASGPLPPAPEGAGGVGRVLPPPRQPGGFGGEVGDRHPPPASEGTSVEAGCSARHRDPEASALSSACVPRRCGPEASAASSASASPPASARGLRWSVLRVRPSSLRPGGLSVEFGGGPVSRTRRCWRQSRPGAPPGRAPNPPPTAPSSELDLAAGGFLPGARPLGAAWRGEPCARCARGVKDFFRVPRVVP